MTRFLLLITLLLCLCFVCPLPAGAEEGDGALSYGSTGDAVRALQERLKALGYYTFTEITGEYLEPTQRAVRLFQQSQGLPETGEVDAALLRMLEDPLTPHRYLRMDIPFEGKLAYGSEGDAVRYVQARLQALGYYEDLVSGNFLKNTRDAVKAFQAQNALSVDGIVGEQTWAMLLSSAESAVSAEATPRPTPAPTPVPYRLEVDLTNQVTTAYGLSESGGYTEMVRRMLCSTGTEKDPTPPGTYILNGATSRWCYFPKWGTHAQYWTRIDAYNAFHSVIYSRPDPMALSEGSYTGLGKPASHGCIRLMLEDAKWIYENCGKGTEVLIFEGPEDEELNLSLKIPPLDRSEMLPEPTPLPTQAPEYSAAAPPPLPADTLERGAESETVYWLQARLAELGYYTGTITGGYYGGTESAVEAYQQDRGLSATGNADKETLTMLYGETQAAVATAAPALRIVPGTQGAPDAADIVTSTPTLEAPIVTTVPVQVSTPSAGSTPSPAETPRPSGVPSFYVPRSERERP